MGEGESGNLPRVCWRLSLPSQAFLIELRSHLQQYQLNENLIWVPDCFLRVPETIRVGCERTSQRLTKIVTRTNCQSGVYRVGDLRELPISTKSIKSSSHPTKFSSGFSGSIDYHVYKTLFEVHVDLPPTRLDTHSTCHMRHSYIPVQRR